MRGGREAETGGREAKSRGRRAQIACPFGGDVGVSGRERLERWWEGLPAREKRHLVTLSDPRGESCAHQRRPRRDGSCAWYGVPVRVTGTFVDGERDPEEVFPLDLYEWLIAHERVWLQHRLFHVCTRHEAARAALRVGWIPSTFVCPLRRGDCPMRGMLASQPGRSLGLWAAGAPGLWRNGRSLR